MRNSKNKIVLFVAVAALLVVSTINAGAQETASHKKGEFGLRFMPTFTSLKLKNSSGGTVKGEATLGYGVGALLGINFSDHAGIQGEIIYSSITQKYKDVDVERKITLKYINIPLLLALNTGKSKPVNLGIVAGPQIGLSVGSSVNASSNSGTTVTQAVLSVKKSDLGFAYGAGLDFGLNKSYTTRLGFGFRGVKGLVDISDNQKTSATDSFYVLDRTHISTNSIYIGLSFLF